MSNKLQTVSLEPLQKSNQGNANFQKEHIEKPASYSPKKISKTNQVSEFPVTKNLEQSSPKLPFSGSSASASEPLAFKRTLEEDSNLSTSIFSKAAKIEDFIQIVSSEEENAESYEVWKILNMLFLYYPNPVFENSAFLTCYLENVFTVLIKNELSDLGLYYFSKI